MSVRYLTFVVCLTALWLFSPHQARAQGFGGLGTRAEGFPKPQKGVELTFPTDHGPHLNYRIEWWYLTSNLKGEDGQDYGIQWTLFRSALRPGDADGWDSPQLWMGHAAITTVDQHHVSETRARGGIGQAGVETGPFNAWIDDWSMRESPQSQPALANLKVTASGKDFSYNLDLMADGPLVFHGHNGYSTKSQSGSASYYYSQPFYQVSGMLFLPKGEVKVSGKAWLDREWSSQPLASDQKGWDWVSLHLNDGTKIMGFQLRKQDGKTYTSATWIEADGTSEALPDGAIEMIPLKTALVEQTEVPVEWRISLPARNLDVTIRALNPNSWMKTTIPYWEGPVRITGTHKGSGYLEMTGY